jgi:hypothetical protein
VISTSAGPCSVHTKQIRYWSLTRIECCPARLPTSFSNLFPGGTRRSLRLPAALSWRSFFCAARCMSGPRRGALSRFQTRRVVSSAKDRITSPCYWRALVTSSVSMLLDKARVAPCRRRHRLRTSAVAYSIDNSQPRRRAMIPSVGRREREEADCARICARDASGRLATREASWNATDAHRAFVEVGTVAGDWARMPRRDQVHAGPTDQLAA